MRTIDQLLMHNGCFSLREVPSPPPPLRGHKEGTSMAALLLGCRAPHTCVADRKSGSRTMQTAIPCQLVLGP